MSANEIWTNLGRMQHICMARSSRISRDEFFAEPTKEQRRYYNWMCQQIGSINAGPYWH